MFSDYSYQGNVGIKNAYTYYQPSGLINQWVQCFWQLDIPEGNFTYHAFPDNNVDCIFSLNNLSSDEITLVKPFSTPTHFEMQGETSFFGIRFRLLSHHGLTDIPIGKWQNAQLADIFGHTLEKALLLVLEKAHTFESRCIKVSDLLTKTFLKNTSNSKLDTRLLKFIHYAEQNMSSINLSEAQCAELGLSSRQLRRLAHLYLGLSPRAFYQVMRFQNTLHAMNDSA